MFKNYIKPLKKYCTGPPEHKVFQISNDVYQQKLMFIFRMEGANAYTNVVLVEDSMMHAGFSVINIEAFAETIQCVGLPRDSPFQNGLPNPPISMLKIPFIDDEEEGLCISFFKTVNYFKCHFLDGPKKRKTRRNPSKVKRN